VKISAPEVKVGQIWKDNDKRGPDRYLIVCVVETEKAICLECTKNGNPVTKRKTRISLSRFRPTSTGYRLISEEIK